MAEIKKIRKKTVAKKPAAKKKTVRKTTPKTQPDREFALQAARIARDRNCTDIVILNLKGLSPATNYFVIATGTSDRQARSVADEITMNGKKTDFPRFGVAGYEKGQWILLDFVEVVVHIFNQQQRQYYNLEMLWGDAERLTIDDK